MSYMIIEPCGAVRPAADGFLVKFQAQGTDRTFARISRLGLPPPRHTSRPSDHHGLAFSVDTDAIDVTNLWTYH